MKKLLILAMTVVLSCAYSQAQTGTSNTTTNGQGTFFGTFFTGPNTGTGSLGATGTTVAATDTTTNTGTDNSATVTTDNNNTTTTATTATAQTNNNRNRNRNNNTANAQANSNRNNANRNNNQGTQGTQANNNNGNGMSDRAFLQRAYNDSLLEIQLGEMAQTNSNSGPVQQLGSELVNDHTAALQQIESLAAALGITLNTNTNVNTMRGLRNISNLTGDQFDRAFIRTSLQTHLQDIRLFQLKAAASANPEVEDFARAQLPVLTQHYIDTLDVRDQLGFDNITASASATGKGNGRGRG